MRSKALLLLLAVASAQQFTDLFNIQSGKATYYGDDGTGGNCQIYPVPQNIKSNIDVSVAMVSAYWFGSAACGSCIQIIGSGNGAGSNPVKGNFTAFVNDQCPTCVPGGLDFAKNGDGLWDIKWRVVDCPTGNSGIYYAYQGSNEWYIKVQVRNHRTPLNYISIQNPNTKQYQKMKRTGDNFFELPDGFPVPVKYPAPVQLTSFSGETINDVISSLGNIVQGNGVNFREFRPSNNKNPSPAPAPTPLPKPSPNVTVDCSAMFNSLTCRTRTQSPSTEDNNEVVSTRKWICSNHPQYCSDIENGGKFGTCNSVEQVSYAMNLYYQSAKAQEGDSACVFGGLGTIVAVSPIEIGFDRPGNDLPNGYTTASSASDCQAKCRARSDCTNWAFNNCDNKECWLKNGNPSKVGHSCRASGDIAGRNGGGDDGGNDNNNPTTGRVFVGYWADWMIWGNCQVQPESVPADRYTHINWAFASFDGNQGYLKDLDGSLVKRIMALKNKNKNLKIMASLGGGSFGSKPWSTLINNNGAYDKYTSSVKGWLDKYGFDGLDIDWEFPQGGEQAKVTEFFRRTRAAIGNGKLLTTAGPSAYFLNEYVPEKWAQYVDFINVMNYDYAGSWSDTTGSLSPLDGIENTMNTYVKRGVPVKKLVYGLANYGYTWTVNNGNYLGAKTSGTGYAGPCSNSRGYLGAKDIVQLRSNRPSGFKEGWDNNAKMPYGMWGNNFATYENTTSIKYKTDFIKKKGYLGGMLWVMDPDTLISDYIWKELSSN